LSEFQKQISVSEQSIPITQKSGFINESGMIEAENEVRLQEVNEKTVELLS